MLIVSRSVIRIKLESEQTNYPRYSSATLWSGKGIELLVFLIRVFQLPSDKRGDFFFFSPVVKRQKEMRIPPQPSHL